MTNEYAEWFLRLRILELMSKGMSIASIALELNMPISKIKAML